MPATFTTAPIVAVGDAVTSQQWNVLARAFNDRLASGIGDPTWRIWWKAFSLMRNLRAPEGTATPALDEFWRTYIHAGEEDGAILAPGNFAHPLQVFASGNEDASIEPEDVLFNALPSGVPATARAAWDLGKLQRGGHDPATGVTDSPASRIRALLNLWPVSSHGAIPNNSAVNLVTWGGMVRLPTYDTDGFPTFRFRSTTGAADYEYTAAGGWLDVETTADAYRITSLDAAPIVLPYSEWVMDNDGAAFPNRTAAASFQQLVGEFAAGFRGSDAERDGEFDIRQLCADYAAIISSQARLSPARGVSVSETSVLPTYPIISMAGPQSGGATTATHTCATGMHVAGMFVTASGLETPVRLTTTGGDTVTVSNGEAIVWDLSTASGFSLQLVDDLPSGASLEFEIAELITRNGDLADAYIINRRASTRGVSPDEIGTTYEHGKAAGREYLASGYAKGVITLPVITEGDLASLPLYERTRRFLRENLLLLGREHLISHAIVGGKSEFTFTRRTGSGLDMFADWNPIATEAEAEGETNEWLMFLGTNPYNTSGAFKPDGYADVLGCLVGRAHLLSTELTPNSAGARGAVGNMSEGDFSMVTPRIPSAFNYFDQTNAAATDDWLRSNPIYPPDYEVESFELGADTVTIRLTTALRGEGVTTYRTDANAISDYLGYVGGQFAERRTGDLAVSGDASSFRGNCLPRFFFTRKVPLFFEDNNEQQDEDDSKADSHHVRWLHFILDAICEGYLVPQAGADGCERPEHYTIHKLALDTLGKHYSELRGDTDTGAGARGFGPLPNTPFLTEHFNDLAAMVNQLVTVPVELPVKLEVRTLIATDTLPILNQVTSGGAPSDPGPGDSFSGTVQSHAPSGYAVQSDWAPIGSSSITAGASGGVYNVFDNPASPNDGRLLVDGSGNILATYQSTKKEIRLASSFNNSPAMPSSLVGLAEDGDIYLTKVESWTYVNSAGDIVGDGATSCVTLEGINYELEPQAVRESATGGFFQIISGGEGWVIYSTAQYNSNLTPHYVVRATVPLS